jgi:5-methylcytosine-specific restriction endonuclease McrA
MSAPLIKVCEHCGEEYTPSENSHTVQKYCHRRCKEKAAYQRLLDSGQTRKRKGGYNRTTYVTKFMEARQSDMTAPCHYCGKRLEPDGDWVLDHKIPISELFDDFQNPDNLCLSCSKCNYEKGTQDYQEFLTQKQKEINHG